MIKKWKELYLRLPWERKILWTGFMLALLPISLGALWRSAPPEEHAPRAAAAQVDTYIPKGFVLVPIEVQNYEALDSILGQFGVVDLLQTPEGERPHRQRIVARNVRILRAPQNPSHFAILVLESQVKEILNSGAPFFVVVKPPGKSGTEFVKDEIPARRSITYERD